MRIIDKYILKELMAPFIFGVFSFASIMIGTSVLFRIAQLISQYNASLVLAAQLFLYALPSIVVITFPMSMLLASLLSVGKLSGASEILAMKAGGASFNRLAAPILIVAFLVSMAAMLINETLVPYSNERYNYIVEFNIRGNTTMKTQEHIVVKDIDEGKLGRLMYARVFNGESGVMNNVTVQEFGANEQIVRTESAEKALWESDKWTMYNGIVNNFDENGKVVATMRFSQQELPIKQPPAKISLEQKKKEEMSIRELKQQVALLKMEKAPTSELEVELYQRVATPLTCFVFAMIGVPLGLQPNRSSSSIGLGLSIVIIFIYYTIMTIMTAIGQGGVLPPVIASFLPDILCMFVGIYLMRKASK